MCIWCCRGPCFHANRHYYVQVEGPGWDGSDLRPAIYRLNSILTNSNYLEAIAIVCCFKSCQTMRVLTHPTSPRHYRPATLSSESKNKASLGGPHHNLFRFILSQCSYFQSCSDTPVVSQVLKLRFGLKYIVWIEHADAPCAKRLLLQNGDVKASTLF